MKKANNSDLIRSAVQVSVNVTKIVKYVCICGTAIVAIVFGSKCYCSYLENKTEEQD